MISYLLKNILLNFLIFFYILKISYIFNLVDKPNERKKHLKPTAYTGGIALSLIYILSVLLFDNAYIKLNLILSIAFLIGIVGFIDDSYNLNIGSKLSLQIFPIFYLILFQNLTLNNLGDYNFIKLELHSFSVVFTLLCVIFLINSFNYFDGLDGTLSYATFSVLSILYFLVNDTNIRLFLLTISLPLLTFLFFNFSLFKLQKLFLGDSGSLLLGFIVAFSLIFLANEKIIHPILLAWSISIFVFEFLSINLIRMINKKKLFKPGLDHLHHVLHKKTKSLNLTNIIIFTKNIIFFSFGYLSFKYINPDISLFLFIILFMFFFILRIKFLND